MKTKIIMLCIAAMTLNSCALIFNGVNKSVSIKSMTPDAKIYVDGNFEGTDAVAVKLRREDNHTVIVKKEGYVKEVVQINTHVQVGWVIFDALFSWVGLLVDVSTSAWNKFDKTKITVDLDEEK